MYFRFVIVIVNWSNTE